MMNLENAEIVFAVSFLYFSSFYVLLLLFSDSIKENLPNSFIFMMKMEMPAVMIKDMKIILTYISLML